MEISKYKTIDQAQKAQWNFNPDRKYYRLLRELYDFLSHISVNPEKICGIYRYNSLKTAAEQEIAWKVMAPYVRYSGEKGKNGIGE